MLKRPIFVALEGVDCAGKGTMAKKVVKALEHTPELEGTNIHLVSFPDYELLSGQMIKKYLNGDYKSFGHGYWDMRFFAGLYTANRQEYFRLNDVDKHGIYIFDRYIYSNVTHQLPKIVGDVNEAPLIVMAGRVESIIQDLFENEPNSIVTDPTTFYLDIDIDTCMYRLNHRKNAKHDGKDIHENRDHLNKSIEFVKWLRNAASQEDVVNGWDFNNIAHLQFIDVKKEDGVKKIYDWVMKEYDRKKYVPEPIDRKL